MHACVCAHTHTKAEIVAGALGLGMGEQVTKEGAERSKELGAILEVGQVWLRWTKGTHGAGADTYQGTWFRGWLL